MEILCAQACLTLTLLLSLSRLRMDCMNDKEAVHRFFVAPQLRAAGTRRVGHALFSHAWKIGVLQKFSSCRAAKYARARRPQATTIVSVKNVRTRPCPERLPLPLSYPRTAQHHLAPGSCSTSFAFVQYLLLRTQLFGVDAKLGLTHFESGV